MAIVKPGSRPSLVLRVAFPMAMMERLATGVSAPKLAIAQAAPAPLMWQSRRLSPWSPMVVSNLRGSAYGQNLAHGRRDASRRRRRRYSLPAGWVWAARALDFKAPSPLFRGAPGGEPVAIPTIAHTEARNIAFPMPGKNKKVRKAILAHATLDTNKEVQQIANEGSTCMHQMNVNVVQKCKRADIRLLDRPASPSPSFTGVPADGSLQLASLISKGDPTQKAPRFLEMDTAVLWGSSSMRWRPQRLPLHSLSTRPSARLSSQENSPGCPARGIQSGIARPSVV